MNGYAAASAIVSEDGLYRYRLYRRWSESRHCRVMCFIMLNPSTADGEVDDPTIRRCVGFAKRERCGALVVVNQYAWRATDPTELRNVSEVVARGPANAHYLFHAVDNADLTVCAWGNNLRRATVWTGPSDASYWSLGPLTGMGQPRHPLYVSGDTELVRYDPPTN